MTRLLIADDHPLFRAALRQAASESVPDCNVREAADLDSALAVLASEPDIDLVLLDLHMPGSQGLSGLAALRGQWINVLITDKRAAESLLTAEKLSSPTVAESVPTTKPRLAQVKRRKR